MSEKRPFFKKSTFQFSALCGAFCRFRGLGRGVGRVDPSPPHPRPARPGGEVARSRHPPEFKAVSVSWALKNRPLLSCETHRETFGIFVWQFWPFPPRHSGCWEPTIPLSVTRLRKPSALAIASPFGAHSGLRPFHGFNFGFWLLFLQRGGLALLWPFGCLGG